ncbi:S8 family serine peptidase [Paeniclostridium hominis]|uniref:S8 family serine peptidase n=1 Tax=Paeniclostridium hominis TaxID=2764329 RepID=UPI0022E6D240|nr:S8 family serine peptidase [Paeniclostridium hominis]
MKIKVAVVDTGVDTNHEYLKNNLVGGVSFDSKDGYIITSEDYEDQNGHGTSCASIIKKEFEDVEIFAIKALDNLGRTNIQILEESLKYILGTDIKIVNLSLSVMESELVRDLYKICEDLKNEGKIIICSVANGFELSYPAQFDNVIGVRGFILEDEKSIWYNKNYEIQSIVDNNSYLSCDINNSYKLFGKCNSQAAAKLTGIIASLLNKDPDMRLEDINQKLEKLCRKSNWTMKDLQSSKRYPEFKDDKIDKNSNLIKEVESILREELEIDVYKDELYDMSLFNSYIGLNNNNCFNVIKKIEEKFDINLDYMSISRYDFVSIYTLADLVQKNLN